VAARGDHRRTLFEDLGEPLVTRLRILLSRLWGLVRHRQVERDIDDEIASHLAEAADDYIQQGLSPEDAHRAALRSFGGVTQTKEVYRQVRSFMWLDDLRQDLRHTGRTLLKSPVFTIVIILTLALGIGATTAIFSLVNSLLLERLPVREPEHLVALSSPTPINQGRVPGWTYRTWDQLRQHADMFHSAFAVSLQQQFNISQRGVAERVDGFYVSGEFFDTLGIGAFLGRTLIPADDVRGGGENGAVVVISHGLWQRRFGGAVDVVGRQLVVDRIPFTIVGVTPSSFFGTEVGQTFEVMLPIGTEPLIRGTRTWLDGPGQWLRVMLRLRSGQSIDAATAVLRGVQPQIRAAAIPENAPPRAQQEFLKEPFTLIAAAGGTSGLRTQYRRPLLVILAVVALVLLVASANIANLLFARALARRHEFSLRTALGASRWRLVRQLFVESLMLAGTGAAIGLAFAAWGSRVLVAQLSTWFNHVFLDLSLDWRVLAFTIIVSAGTAVTCGTLPALRATRVCPNDAMKEHGPVGPSDGKRRTLSSGLVVVQVALSFVVIVAAGLLVQTFQRLATTPRGFDAEGVLVVYTDMTHVRTDPANRMALYDRLVENVAAVPGVTHTAVSPVTPVSGLSMTDVVETDDPNIPEAERRVLVNFVSPGWFATYGIPILEGRDFSARDTTGSPPVFVINEAFARRFFPAGNAVGATINSAAAAPLGVRAERKLVIGVISNALYRSLREEPQPTIYAPLAQLAVTPPDVSISVRTSAGAQLTGLQRSIAAALSAVNTDLAFSFLPLTDQVNASLGQERLVAILAGSLGVLALLLAGTGLYGVTSYTVALRQTEMAVRMAIGATPAMIIRLTLFKVLAMVGIGIAAGIVASIWSSQLLAALLYGSPARDPETLVAAAVVLGASACLGGWAPTARVFRIHPAAILRST